MGITHTLSMRLKRKFLFSQTGTSTFEGQVMKLAKEQLINAQRLYGALAERNMEESSALIRDYPEIAGCYRRIASECMDFCVILQAEINKSDNPNHAEEVINREKLH